MNKIMLVGRLVEDAKSIRGGAVFTLAVNQNLKTKFIPAVTFNEKVMQYMAKGRLISIDGHLEASKKDGKTRLIVIADSVSLLDKKKEVSDNARFEDNVTAGEMADVSVR